MKTNIKTLLTVLLLILSQCIFFSCSTTDDQKEFSIVIPSENDIQTLDPTILSDPYTSRIVWQIYEGLVGLDNEGKGIPLIAESWSSNENNTIWTFQIRPGVYFHKSKYFENQDSTRSVNAYDVLYSYNKYAKGFGSFVFSGLVQGFDSYLQNLSNTVSGFNVKDSTTFEVLLINSDPSFIYRITSPYMGIVPKEVVEGSGADFGKSVTVGTGPFKFDRRTETEVYLSKNENYWKETKGTLSEVIFRVEKNQQLRVTQFQNGKYNLLQLPVNSIQQFLDGKNLKEEVKEKYSLYSKTTYNIHYLGIDCNLVPDEHLRRAINYAINKKIIIAKLLYDEALEASSPVNSGMLGYIPPTGLGYNIDLAKQELKISKYKGASLKLFVSDAPNSEQLGQVIQDDLKKVGITVEIVKLDFNTLISRLFSQERPEMFMMFSEWIYSAPELIIDSYNSKKIPNPNVFNYKNVKVDSLISRIPIAQDREEINRLCYEAESIALQDVPAVWLYHQNNIYLMPKRIKNFTVNAHNNWNLSEVYAEE